MPDEAPAGPSSLPTPARRLAAFLNGPVTLLTPLFTAPPLAVATWLVCRSLLGLRLEWWGVVVEAAAQVGIGVLLACLARRRWLLVVTQVPLAISPPVAAQLHITMFGRPLMPDDLHAVTELLGVLPTGTLLLALASPTLLVVGILANLDARRLRARVGAAVLVALLLALRFLPEPFFLPLDHLIGSLAWDHARHYQRLGPTVFFLSEAARLADARQEPPTRSEVSAALRAARQVRASRPHLGRGRAGLGRNVHVLILESFWDPALLSGAALSADPFGLPLRALWRQAGQSVSLSPVAGGRTANAEFEVLCGTPYIGEGVAFETGLLDDAPCLPRLLAARGYRTLAFHPNVPAFWNRVQAYRRVGFQRYMSAADFAMDDTNGPYLSDASLYRQAEAVAARTRDSRPTLSYIVSITGHWEYELDPKRRPHVITAGSSLPQVESYANSILYSSQELYDYLSRLGKDDPEALIVVLGDHTPALGRNAAGYVESGLAGPDRAAWTPAMFRTLHATPLLVLDGFDRPVDVGAIGQFEVTRVILDLLGIEDETVADLFLSPPDTVERPLYDGILELNRDKEAHFCHPGDDSGPCAGPAAWRQRAELLSRDIFVGRQHALAMLGGATGQTRR